ALRADPPPPGEGRSLTTGACAGAALPSPSATCASREASINLRQLKYYAKVAEVGNITRAAEQLSVAQPALGLQIRQLEQELGVELLTRHSRGVVPTEAGSLLLERARGILAMVEETKRDVRALGGARSETLTLGLTPSIM